LLEASSERALAGGEKKLNREHLLAIVAVDDRYQFLAPIFGPKEDSAEAAAPPKKRQRRAPAGAKQASAEDHLENIKAEEVHEENFD
jgi:hypothetical protein